MLFSMGHGQVVPLRSAQAGGQATTDVAEFSNATARAGNPDGSFGFLFPGAQLFPDRPDTTARLDALGNAMGELSDAEGGEIEKSRLPAIFTYFGQFIDHDLTAATDSDPPNSASSPLRISVNTLNQANRSLVRTTLQNLRVGSLGLDSVYGDGTDQSPAVLRLEAQLRDPDGLRMRVGEVGRLPGNPSSRPLAPLQLPGDKPRHADLPRLALVVPNTILQAELPGPLEALPLDVLRQRALIADARNDENLIVAQLHVAVLRFHNAMVARLGSGATFEAARDLTVLHYQWLVGEEYLPAVCDPAVVADVKARRAPLYRQFLAAEPGSRRPGTIPVEFAVAGFRFGHSMVRDAYDFNDNFRTADDPPAGTLQFLFQFTGAGGLGDPSFTALPDNWVIDWNRFLSVTPDQAARPIDTRLAKTLKDMPNRPTDNFQNLLKQLARRNLRRGYALGLPSAQALIGELRAAGIADITPLTPEQLKGSSTGANADRHAAVRDGGFAADTPLWYYILREAELTGAPHLGPLGSRIVAETLWGLLITDPHAYPARGWTPDLAPGAATQGRITDFESFLRTAGAL